LEELSIVGFDEIEIGSFINPNLTTIWQPAYGMGKVGTEVLLNQIGQKSIKPVHKMLETKPVVRESTTTVSSTRKQNRLNAKRVLSLRAKKNTPDIKPHMTG
jgi:type II secretory pathway component HofQ